MTLVTLVTPLKCKGLFQSLTGDKLVTPGDIAPHNERARQKTMRLKTAKGKQMTTVRLTFAARCRFPDIATAIGTVTAETGHWISVECGQWRRVEWPGERTTWLRAEDLEPIQNDETDISE